MSDAGAQAWQAPAIAFRGEPVYHVGLLDAAEVGGHGTLEGDGLSVSTCPDAWRSIARLGGAPTQALSKPDARFLDVLALTDEQRSALLERARARGLLRWQGYYRAAWFDDELDATVSMYCRTVEEALAAVGVDWAEDAESAEGTAALERVNADDVALEFVEVPVGTAALERLHPHTSNASDPVVAPDLALAAVAAELGFDGCWWRERLDPVRYSAPRGMIWPADAATLARWSIDDLGAAPGPDDDEEAVDPGGPWPSQAVADTVEVPDGVLLYHGGTTPLTTIADRENEDGGVLCASASINVAERYGEHVVAVRLSADANVREISINRWFHGDEWDRETALAEGYDALRIHGEAGRYDFPADMVLALHPDALEIVGPVDAEQRAALDDGHARRHEPHGPGDREWDTWMADLADGDGDIAPSL